MKTFRHAVLVLALPLTLVLLGAKDCPESSGGGAQKASTPCDDARDAANALYSYWDQHPTDATKKASDNAEAHAIQVCAAEGR